MPPTSSLTRASGWWRWLRRIRHPLPRLFSIFRQRPARLAINRVRGRRVSPEVIEKQAADLRDSLPGLEKEGFWRIYVLDNTEDIDSARVSLGSQNA